EPEDLFRDRTRGYPTDRFRRAGPAASLPVAESVLRVVREVGVRGTVGSLERLVRAGPRSLVVEHEEEGCSDRAPFEDAGKDAHAVRLLAGGGDAALSGTTAIELRLHIRGRKREPGRTAIHDHSDAAAVGLSPGGDREELAEDGSAHGRGC